MTTTNAVTERTWNVDRGQPTRLYIPAEMLERYIAIAMRTATPRQLEDGRWYADLPRFSGVWADGPSPKECLDTLEEVLSDWLIVKLADGDRDIPVVDEIDLTVLL